MSPTLLPVFLKLERRRVLVVGGGPVATSKVGSLLAAGARVRLVAPEVSAVIPRDRVEVHERRFRSGDLEGVWLAVAAATPAANRQVARAAAARRIFVNAVDDPQAATAYLGGVLRRDGVTIAVSTEGAAPALAGLLREGLAALLPADLGAWVKTAKRLRPGWRRTSLPHADRRPRLLRALNSLYGGTVDGTGSARHAKPGPA